MPTIEAAIINCFRPGNVLRILGAISPQVSITTVLECAEHAQAWPSSRVIRFLPKLHDLGPWTRYAVAGLYEQEYTLLIDDDLLPDADMVNRFLEHGERHDLVCGMGRKLTTDGGYRGKNCPPGEADIGIRCYFWRTSVMRETVPKAMARLTLEERRYDDDIAMCLCSSRKAFVLHGKVPWTELPCPNASSSTPGHLGRRDALCRRLINGNGLETVLRASA
jgi:hypothetical protein